MLRDTCPPLPGSRREARPQELVSRDRSPGSATCQVNKAEHDRRATWEAQPPKQRPSSPSGSLSRVFATCSLPRGWGSESEAPTSPQRCCGVTVRRAGSPSCAHVTTRLPHLRLLSFPKMHLSSRLSRDWRLPPAVNARGVRPKPGVRSAPHLSRVTELEDGRVCPLKLPLLVAEPCGLATPRPHHPLVLLWRPGETSQGPQTLGRGQAEHGQRPANRRGCRAPHTQARQQARG